MYLGIDLGTSSLKALLVNPSQSIISEANIPYSVIHSHSGWSEQDPNDWIDACNNAINQLITNAPTSMRDLRAIGISGQMHGATLVDSNDEVLRNCILWNDTRSHQEAAVLDAIPDFRHYTGNIVFPGFTAPKIVWVGKYEPNIFNRIDKILLPKDYLRFWLSGETISEMSDSSGTSWLDVGKRIWSPILLEHTDIGIEHMPTLVEGSEVAAMLRPELARKWGISHPVKIVGGAGDNAAAACGAGIIKANEGFVSLGTSGVILAARNSFSPAAASAVHSFCHALPNTWVQMGVMLSATNCLNWLANMCSQDVPTLASLLPKSIKAPSTATFMPYLSGERTPHNDSQIRAGFFRLDISHGQAEIVQSIVEGVSFGLRDNLEALNSTGNTINKLMALGGGTDSYFWLETLATIFAMPLLLPEKGDFSAAFGVARLAMIGDQVGTSEEIISTPKIATQIDPRMELIDLYQEQYQSFRSAYSLFIQLQQ